MTTGRWSPWRLIAWIAGAAAVGLIVRTLLVRTATDGVEALAVLIVGVAVPLALLGFCGVVVGYAVTAGWPAQERARRRVGLRRALRTAITWTNYGLLLGGVAAAVIVARALGSPASGPGNTLQVVSAATAAGPVVAAVFTSVRLAVVGVRTVVDHLPTSGDRWPAWLPSLLGVVLPVAGAAVLSAYGVSARRVDTLVTESLPDGQPVLRGVEALGLPSSLSVWVVLVGALAITAQLDGPLWRARTVRTR